MEHFGTCLNDYSLGPAVIGCRGRFDFTIAFEDAVFVLVPASIFFCLSIARVWTLVTLSRPVVTGYHLQWAKFALATCLAALQLALVVLTKRSALLDTGLSLAASLTAFTASLCLIPLSWLEHSRSPRPSTIISTYLSITFLLDIARTRTAWLLPASGLHSSYPSILTAATTAKAILMLLESHQKTRWLNWDNGKHSPEETSGIYSLGVYFWLNRLFLNGYRVVMTLDNLYPLDQALKAEVMPQCRDEKRCNNSYRGRKYGLARRLLRDLAFHLLPPMIPRAVLLAASMCQPLLIHALLHYLQDNQEDESHGYGLIGGTALIYGTIAVSTALYWYFQERFVIRVRGCLVRAIYEKSTELKVSTSDAGALTLMSTDVERVVRGILDLHEYWANIIQIALSCWLLERELGLAFLAPLGVVLLSTLLAFVIGKFIGPCQRAWMEAIQIRVSATANAISQMKLVKMSGMTKPLQASIQRLRMSEIRIGSKWRMLVAGAATVSQVPMAISPVVTFALTTTSLDTTSIFVSLSYLTLLTAPLNVLFQKIPQLLGALTCLQRIQTYLEQEPRQETRQLSKKLHEVPQDPQWSSASGIGMQNLDFKHSSYISIQGANFGWDSNTPILKDVNLSIPPGTLTVIFGPVASGKSTLCKAILGEVPYATGVVTVLHARKIAYCDQVPFLTNDSIRENIIQNSAFDEKRYHEVLTATMLDRDLATFPQGDRTLIGSGGSALSGGQRQRLAIARALYVEGTDLFMFDDVLSGLDARTSNHVFSHVLGRNGMLRKRGATILLCTHNPQHLQFADQALMIDAGGRVRQESQPASLGSELEGLDLELPDAKVDNSDNKISSLTKTGPSLKVTDMTAEEAEARKTGDISVYGHYARTIGFPYIAAFLFFSACYGFLINFSRIWLTLWSNDSAEMHPTHTKAYYLGIYAFLQVMTLLSFIVAAGIKLGPFVKRSGSVLHHRALETVVNAPLKLFTTADTGTITNYFSQDMTLIDNELPMAIINVALNIFEIIGMAVLLATSSPWLALTYPAMIFVLYLIQRFYLRTSRQLRLLDLEAKAPLYTHFIDTSTGIATIRAFNWVAESIRRNYHLLNQSQRPMYLLAMVQRWLFLTLNMVVAVTATVLVALMTRLRSSSSLSGASLVTLMTLSESLSSIVRYYAALETSIGAVARLKNFTTQTGAEGGGDEDDDERIRERWPKEGVVDLKDVWASYG